uniref:Uncharacterized protein n=1 Tax=Sphaerodactylus townsendi TaxID=933632 RepID=A0ACB8FTM4_9SAUR
MLVEGRWPLQPGAPRPYLKPYAGKAKATLGLPQACGASKRRLSWKNSRQRWRKRRQQLLLQRPIDQALNRCSRSRCGRFLHLCRLFPKAAVEELKQRQLAALPFLIAYN